MMRVSEANTPKRLPTKAQLTERLLTVNPVKLWQKFNGDDRPSFEDRKPLQSDYNLFCSVNNKLERVFLTKQMAEANACVATHAVISSGSLPTIEQKRPSEDSDLYVSDISVGSMRIDASTTIAQLSAAIINNNAPGRFVETDVIACFLARQSIDALTSFPMVEIKFSHLYLDPNDTTPISETLTEGVGFQVNSDGFLTFTAPALTLGSYVQTRADQENRTRVKVSSQNFLGDNPMIQQFGTEQAFLNAAHSYGGWRKDRPLRHPNTRHIKVVAAEAPSNDPETDTGNTGPTQGGSGSGSNPTPPGGGSSSGDDEWSR